ncbi:MAG TPA: hypothetical protein VFP27_19190 [Mycobacterium sp.]|nr:hypothetical protein [Mycobacterium sp.]
MTNGNVRFTFYDPREYMALVGRIRRSRTRAELEGFIPEVCSFANGTLRHELSRTWYATWCHLFPGLEIDTSLWPPEK